MSAELASGATLNFGGKVDPAATSLTMRVVRTRHDLHNALTHILGFSEMLLEELPEQGREPLRTELELINRTAAHLMTQIGEKLDAPKIKAGHIDLSSLERQICKQAAQIETTSEALAAKLQGAADEVFKSDLARITGAAQRMHEL